MLLPSNLPSFDAGFNNSGVIASNNTTDMDLSNYYTNILIHK